MLFLSQEPECPKYQIIMAYFKGTAFYRYIYVFNYVQLLLFFRIIYIRYEYYKWKNEVIEISPMKWTKSNEEIEWDAHEFISFRPFYVRQD